MHPPAARILAVNLIAALLLLVQYLLGMVANLYEIGRAHV